MASTRVSIDPLLAIYYLFLLFLQLSPTLASIPKRPLDETESGPSKSQKTNDGQSSPRQIDCRGPSEIGKCYVTLHESGSCSRTLNCQHVLELFKKKGHSVRIRAEASAPNTAASSSSITSNLIPQTLPLVLQQYLSSKGEPTVADYCHCKEGFFFKDGREGECIDQEDCLADNDYPHSWAFVQQWPVIKLHKHGMSTARMSDRWWIHGHWPADKDGRPMTGEVPDELSRESSKSFRWELGEKDNRIVEKLSRRWKNFRIRDGHLEPDEDFWLYQWLKHGTRSRMTQLDYFYFAIELYDLSRLLRGNTRYPLVPDNTRRLTPWKMSQAIMEAIPQIKYFQYQILCELPEYGKSKGKSFLIEFRICFTAGYPKRFARCALIIQEKVCPREFYYGEP